MQEESVQPQKAENQPSPSLEEQLAEARAKLAANAQKYALERFANGLLPVLDSLEAAVRSADLSGVELVLRQLATALDKANIREVNPAPGERFDPYRHQAMAAVESNTEPNTVVSVMQKGYTLADRVLRPALVTVAKAVEKPAGNPISDTDLD
jgi:molecular chaperone GrpE